MRQRERQLVCAYNEEWNEEGVWVVRIYLDASAKLARPKSAATVLVITVEDNKTAYTNAEFDRAKHARQLQTTIGRPSTRVFIKIVLPGCPVAKQDIMAAEDLFGPDRGNLKGKSMLLPTEGKH